MYIFDTVSQLAFELLPTTNTSILEIDSILDE